MMVPLLAALPCASSNNYLIWSCEIIRTKLVRNHLSRFIKLCWWGLQETDPQQLRTVTHEIQNWKQQTDIFPNWMTYESWNWKQQTENFPRLIQWLMTAGNESSRLTYSLIQWLKRCGTQRSRMMFLPTNLKASRFFVWVECQSST
jgi:hypothetical protein